MPHFHPKARRFPSPTTHIPESHKFQRYVGSTTYEEYHYPTDGDHVRDWEDWDEYWDEAAAEDDEDEDCPNMGVGSHHHGGVIQGLSPLELAEVENFFAVHGRDLGDG